MTANAVTVTSVKHVTMKCLKSGNSVRKQQRKKNTKKAARPNLEYSTAVTISHKYRTQG